MKLILQVLCINIVLIFFSCSSTKQPLKPMENYNVIENKPSISNIVIPVNINAKEIETILNQKISGTLYEDNDMTDDGLKLKAVKSSPIKTKISGLTMEYIVPLQLHIVKDIKVSNITTEGDIAIKFKTSMHIREDWQLVPETEVVDYEWIKAPVVKTALVDIPVKYIANLIMNKFKSELTNGIDNSIKKSVDIKSSVVEMWNKLQEPVKVNEEYKSWVKLTPQTITMTPLYAKTNMLQSFIGITTFTEVLVGDKPAFRANSTLPPFKFAAVNDDAFNINVDINIPLEEAEKIAEKIMVGQEFGEGGKKVKLLDLTLYGQGSKMIINTHFTGSYSGSLYIFGTPYFNAKTNSVEFKELDFDLETKNFLLKSAKWLFSKTILNKLKENMVFPLEQNLTTMKETISKEFSDYSVNSNVKMKCNLNSINVETVDLIPGNIKVKMNAKGKMNIDFKAF